MRKKPKNQKMVRKKPKPWQNIGEKMAPSQQVASPHLYGCKLKMQKRRHFQQEYPGQVSLRDECTLKEPDKATLMEWSQSCLGLGPFEGMYCFGGWSPFRSGEVYIKKFNRRKESFPAYFKLGDFGDYDFTSAVCPTTVSIQPWLKSVSLFARLALNQLVYAQRRNRGMNSPETVVRRMLHGEWGVKSTEFGNILEKNSFGQCDLDEIVDKTWTKMINLPVPAAYAYFDDAKVLQKILDIATYCTQSGRPLTD
jgi:hypothetical protein